MLSKLNIIWLVMLFLLSVLQSEAVNPPVISVRFNHPVYDCKLQTYCVDVEFNANTPGLKIYDMNVRFFYETSVLQYVSTGNFAKWYTSRKAPMPYITSENGANFGITGNVTYWNGSVYLVNPFGDDFSTGTGIVTISSDPLVWTRLFSLCFKVLNPSDLAQTGICPALIWDLQVDPLKGGFGDQSDGVVITYLNPGTVSGYLSAAENAVQYNWAYDADPSTLPYGGKNPGMCITTFDDPPVVPVPNGKSTIPCPVLAVPPVVPFATDNCGTSSTITGVLESVTDLPDPLACEGTRTYTYKYTGSTGKTAYWLYEYTIEYEPFSVPEDKSSTTECAAHATEPVPPVVRDYCGNILQPQGPVRGGTYDGCSGTLTYQWSFTDCEGNTDSWTYTYIIYRTTGPALTGSSVPQGSTVSSLSEAIPPALLPMVTDICGKVLSPTADSPVKKESISGCGGTVTYTYHWKDCAGFSLSWTYTYIVSCTDLEAKVMLEGAMMNLMYSVDYYTDSMRTTLNYKHMLPGQTYKTLSGKLVYLPAGQPYSADPWNYAGSEGSLYDSGGTEVSRASYPATVVDWVLVSLRAGVNGPSLCRKAGLVHKDGTIELPGGFGCYDLNPAESYYLVVEHRSHLLVMSDKPLPIVNGKVTYDFTAHQSYRDPAKPAYIGQKLIKGLKYAMYAGNGMQVPGNSAADTDVNGNDQKYWSDRTGLLGFLPSDYNLNGDTNADDQMVWERSNGLTTGVPRN